MVFLRLPNIQGELIVQVQLLDQPLVVIVLGQAPDAIVAGATRLVIDEEVILEMVEQLLHIPYALTVAIAYSQLQFAHRECLQCIGLLF